MNKISRPITKYGSYQNCLDLPGEFSTVNTRIHEHFEHSKTKEKQMKTMTCKQLGGACDKEFTAETFDEITDMSKAHGMEMFQQKDEDYLKAMGEMQKLMQDPIAMGEWFESKRKEFENV